MSQPHKINLNLPTSGEMNRHFFNASGTVGGTAGHSLSATGSIGGQYNFSNGAFAGGSAGGTYQRIGNVKVSGWGAEAYVGYNFMHGK